MFNLGSKSMIINTNELVSEVASAGGNAGVLTIKGFGDFTIPALSAGVGAITVSKPAAAGVYTAVIPGFVDTSKYDISLKIRHVREIAGLFTDGDIKSFQTGAGASIGTAAAAGQIEGFNDDIVKFSGTGNNLIVTFQPGWEGAYIETITVTEAVTEADLPVTSIAVTTAPEYGVGLGKIIEEEVQNATEANLDPYGFGGKHIVDIRGTYTEISWTSPAGTFNEGWEPHASLGRNDVNTEAVHGGTSFIVYVNEVSAAAAITALSKLVNGEAPVA